MTRIGLNNRRTAGNFGLSKPLHRFSPSTIPNAAVTRDTRARSDCAVIVDSAPATE